MDNANSYRSANFGGLSAEECDGIRAEQDRPRAISEKSSSIMRSCIAVDMTQPLEEGNVTRQKLLEKARSVQWQSLVVVSRTGS